MTSFTGMKELNFSRSVVSTILLFFTFYFLHQSPVKAQEKIGITMTQAHPRLLLLKGEEKVIQSKIKDNPFLRRIHNFIILKCDAFLDTPVLSYELIGKRLLKVSRTAYMRIYYLSYAWRMTGNAQYAERARQELINICKFKDWNPTHGLDVAEMTMAAAIGYDWLYSYLDEDTKQVIRSAIIKYAINESMPETATHKSHYSWLKKENNWNAVCNTGMAYGALATFESNPEVSQKIIERSIRLVRDRGMNAYRPDGNYPEGYTYWSYGTGYSIQLIDVLEKIYGTSFGIADQPGFSNTPNYILQMSTQNQGCFAYSDCTSNHNLSFPMFWFAQRNKNQSLLWAEQQKLDYLEHSGYKDDAIFGTRFLPSVLFWASPNTFQSMKKPEQKLYVAQGLTPVALMRNHWGGNSEIFVGLKGGSCITNHSHMDIGSFVMYKGPNQWVKDLGIQEYESLEKYGFNLGDRNQTSARWKAFRLGNKSHNVMIFNGNDQVVKSKAYIDSYGDTPNFRYAASDLSAIDSPGISKRIRGVAIVDNSYVIVKDEVVNADHFTDVRWAILTPSNVKIIDEHSAQLSMNGETLLMKVEGKGIKMGTWPTTPQYSFDEENPGTVMVGFTSVMEPGEKTAFTVFLIPENAKVRPEQVKSISEWKY